MKEIMVTSANEYARATRKPGTNKIIKEYFEVLSTEFNINIRYESGYEVWKNKQIIAANCSSSPVYIANEYGTTDNRARYSYCTEREA
jgi:hypothetical protein